MPDSRSAKEMLLWEPPGIQRRGKLRTRLVDVWRNDLESISLTVPELEQLARDKAEYGRMCDTKSTKFDNDILYSTQLFTHCPNKAIAFSFKLMPGFELGVKGQGLTINLNLSNLSVIISLVLVLFLD
ncbi:unnamed protein product [Didymodactylos carnosus]|uniref:Uncharacterized protein n=1 Tax=Didymodactylos carnosus TaxID=1234261 RepID=A0A814BI29_9BILA|nr:unnamed protein product [Didymodactylos carnosus]CAF3705548.1 unnamed protein product [Didymodactylos carnosus]